jgi:hypothetical protein
LRKSRQPAIFLIWVLSHADFFNSLRLCHAYRIRGYCSSLIVFFFSDHRRHSVNYDIAVFGGRGAAFSDRFRIMATILAAFMIYYRNYATFYSVITIKGAVDGGKGACRTF